MISYDICLSLTPLLHSEWPSLVSFLWLNLALFPTSLWLRNTALCPSSVSIHLYFLPLACFPDLAIVHCGAKIARVPVSFKFWNCSRSLPRHGTAGPYCCGLSSTVTGFCEYWRKAFLCIRHARTEERKAGDHPCGLSKLCIYLCLNLIIPFCVVNYFACISFISARRNIIWSFLHCCWLYLEYDPQKSILVGKIGIIAVVGFHVWVMARCVLCSAFLYDLAC